MGLAKAGAMVSRLPSAIADIGAAITAASNRPAIVVVVNSFFVFIFLSPGRVLRLFGDSKSQATTRRAGSAAASASARTAGGG